MEYKSLRPAQVLLDSQNPRLPDGTSTDREAINRLLSEGYSQLLALARDLAERGEGNPTELPIVIRDRSRYIVLEGNRRFAALKLLRDPQLADEPTHQVAFERVKRGKQPPRSLYCVVAADRDEADPWLTLRHTGANEGIGVRGWSAEQTARHRRRMKAPVDSGTVRAIAIADELTEAYQSDTDLVQLIQRVRTARLTNIGRFFSGVTLSRMQFQIRPAAEGGSPGVWVKNTAADLHAYFTWAFEFLNDKSVDAFKNDMLRSALIDSHSEILPPAANALPDFVRITDMPYSPLDNDDISVDEEPPSDHEDENKPNRSTPAEPPVDQSAPNDPRENGDPDDADPQRKRDQKPEIALYSKVRLPNLSPNIQRLLKEARGLRIDDNYAVACVLARVILELAVSEPKVLAWSGKAETDNLSRKIKGCILKLDPNIDNPKKTRRDLVQAYLEVSNVGVTYLHQFVHNSETKADPALARRFSYIYTPLLNSINGAVG